MTTEDARIKALAERIRAGVRPTLVPLPFKATSTQTGEPLTLEEVQTLFACGLDNLVHIERSYPGAPDAIGWTLFARKDTYAFAGNYVAATQTELRPHIRSAYADYYQQEDQEL